MLNLFNKHQEKLYMGPSTPSTTIINHLIHLYTLSVGDSYVHHAIALGLHITVLILLKGGLEARGSKLMPDKMEHSFGFSCDGPGRGGTCDISAWDSFYLATFWMLNSNTWISFYFHYKHLTPRQFSESSTYLESWFRDYLWFNSTPLIHGYSTLGTNDLSVQSWSFLLTHLAWASGFMFLISWRGYWQELIDIILYIHLKTPILINLWNETSTHLSPYLLYKLDLLGLFTSQPV